jgi:hypothetical protein
MVYDPRDDGPPADTFLLYRMEIPTPMSVENASFAPAALVVTVLDAWVVGSVCDGGYCRPILQRVYGRVYADGEGCVSWHLPTNPLQGNSLTADDPAMVEAFRGLWLQWAKASE